MGQKSKFIFCDTKMGFEVDHFMSNIFIDIKCNIIYNTYTYIYKGIPLMDKWCTLCYTYPYRGLAILYMIYNIYLYNIGHSFSIYTTYIYHNTHYTGAGVFGDCVCGNIIIYMGFSKRVFNWFPDSDLIFFHDIVTGNKQMTKYILIQQWRFTFLGPIQFIIRNIKHTQCIRWRSKRKVSSL